MPKKAVVQVTPFEMVKEFHQVFNHPVHEQPIVPDAERQRLRALLMIEELAETVETLYGYSKNADCLKDAVRRIRSASILVKQAQPYEFHPDLEHLAKELTDLNYVTNGTGHEFGINLDLAAGETHRSNMSKGDPETGLPIYDETGKVKKGSNYSPADMRAVLDFSNVEVKAA